jgi:hypothetical protein
MTKKILFFIDLWFFHYGIAKYIQEKSDYELYSIIEVEDKAKEFFNQQQFVNFKNIWQYLDNVSIKNKKPDISYLKKFEEKYGIDLWKIAYSERVFYQYNKFHKYTEQEILTIIEQEARFFDSVLDEINPDFLSLMAPTSHHTRLLYEICKARGIKCLVFTFVRFANRVMISEYSNSLGIEKINPDKLAETNKSFEDLQIFLKEHDATKKIDEVKKVGYESHFWERYKAIIKFFITNRTPGFKNHFPNFGKTKYKYLIIKISNFVRRKTRTYFINNNLTKELDFTKPFAYFPLHFEPEQVLMMGDAQFYSDQFTVISNIARSLPVDFKLFVKEHPGMKIEGWRDEEYYKKIMQIPNVVLIHPSILSEELIKKCSLVITIAGTTSQEAAFYNRPSICFTEQVFSILPSIYQPKSLEELPEAIKISLKRKINPKEIEEYIRIINENTFELNLSSTSADFGYRFGLKGLIMDAKLKKETVGQILIDYKSMFEKLADEHIKKIEDT